MLQTILFMSQRCGDLRLYPACLLLLQLLCASASSKFVWIEHPWWTAMMEAMHLGHQSDPFRPFSWFCGEDSNLGGLQELQMRLSNYTKPVENEVKWMFIHVTEKLASFRVQWLATLKVPTKHIMDPLLALFCNYEQIKDGWSRVHTSKLVALRNYAVVMPEEKKSVISVV